MGAWRSVAVGVAVLAASGSAAWAQGACSTPAKAPVIETPLGGAPFAAVASADGCSLFVSLMADGEKRPSEVLILSRKDGEPQIAVRARLPGRAGGLALDPAGRLLAVATGGGVALLDVGKLAAGGADALVAAVGEAPNAGAINVAFGQNGKLLVVADENTRTIGVYDVAKALAHAKDARIGGVPVGIAPAGLAVSPDGRWLYATVEMKDGSPDCRPPDGQASWSAPGALEVIDLDKAAKSPGAALAGEVQAGCSPVRVALSADGATAYVTARGDDAVLAVRTDRALKDRAHAVIGKAEVGSAPVGIAVSGGKVYVTNSNRFGAGEGQSLSVLDAADLSRPAVSVPAGRFPRSVAVTGDGKTLVVANFGSGTLQLVDLARLDQARRQPGAP
jgi:DNA-binding beta-propeller fold protein YncE